MPPEDAPPTPAVWLGHHIQTRQGKCFWLMPSAAFLPGPTPWSSWTSKWMPYWCLPSPQDVWTRLVQRHNGTPFSWQCTLTLNGWPDRQGHVPRVARFYWSFQDELSIDGDILTKGEWVVIPPSCRDSIMADLHGIHAGIIKAMDLARMCLLAGHGSRCDWLHQAMSDMHWVQQSTHWEPATPWGPSQTLGKDRCWLLSRPSWEKTPHSSRLLQQVPICVPSGICTSFQDHYSPEGTLCSWRHTCHCHVWQWTPIQWWGIQAVSPWIWLCAHHIIIPFPSIQWIHRGYGEEGQECLQENWWISQCSGLSITSTMWYTHHGRSSFPSRNSTGTSCTRNSSFKTIKTCQYTSDLAEIHPNSGKTERKPTKPTELRIYMFSRLMSKYSSSPISKGQVPCNGWLAQWLKSWNVDVRTWSRPPMAESTEEIEHI